MLEIQNLSKIIGRKKILDNINISFSNGFTCIVGDSGAGKSTLLNILGGLDFPTSGKIDLKNHERSKKNIAEINNYQQDYLGFVFQDANLINGLTVYENIELAAKITGKENNSSEIDNILKQFGLSSVSSIKVECISGGEKLRTAIARAVIKDVPIILADEPTGSLDYQNSVQVFEILKKISKDRIVIAVTHDLTKASKYADRVVTIGDGKILHDEYMQSKDTQANRFELPKQYSTKNQLSLEVIRKLTLNNIKRFKSKFILSLATMGIALAALAIIIAMRCNVSSKIQELNTVYYDADVITFYPYKLGEKSVTSIIMGGNYGIITDEMIQDLSNSNLFCAVIPVCNACYYVSGTEDDIHYKLINVDAFFQNRLMTEKVIGQFPAESNQVIIAKDLSDFYFNGDAIGKTLILANDFGDVISYEIVGINGEKNVDGVYYTYIPVDSVENAKYSNMFSCIYLATSVEDDLKDMYTEDSSGFIDVQTEENVIYGSSLTGSNQILISSDMARELYFSMTGMYIDFSPSSIINADAQLKDCLDLILEQKYYIGTNDAYVCNVVGIHDGLSYKILVSKDWKDSLTCALPNYVECYAKDMCTVINFSNEDLPTKYNYISNYEERFENAVSSTGMWNTMLVIILFVVALLCVVMIHSYGKTAISGRMYEVGVLGSLGLPKKEIKKLLCREIYILSIGAWSCGSMIFLLYMIISSTFSDNYFNIIEIVMIVFGLLFAIAFVSLLIANYEAEKGTKATVIDAIRMRE